MYPELAFQIFLFCALAYASVDDESASNEVSTKNPLVYTRLRHDPGNFQAQRNYQLDKTFEEKQKRLELNETYDDNSSKIVTYNYYENSAINASAVTEDDLILEALDITYKTRLMQMNIYNYDDPKDRQDSSDPSLTSKSKCERELNYLMSTLDLIEDAHRNRQNISLSPELAAFFDSFANEEPGLLFGNYHWTGNWRQCHKRLVFHLDRSNPSNSIAFKGRYCTVSLRSGSWDERIKRKTAKLIREDYFKYPEQKYDYARFFRIQVGFCLPQSCDSQLINEMPWRKNDIHRLSTYKLNQPFKSYDLVDLFCLPDETSKLRRIEPMGWLLIFISFLWCSSVLLATYCDCKRTNDPTIKKRKSELTGCNQVAAIQAGSSVKTNADKLISALSLFRNFHRLTETDSLTDPKTTAVANQQQKSQIESQVTSAAASSSSSSSAQVVMVEKTVLSKSCNQPAPNDLLFLNAYKVIGMLSIMYGHVGMLGIHLDRFPLDYESYDSNWKFHFIGSAVFYVDWYFVITGFLTSYIMFATRKVEKTQLIGWIYSIFHRYWRLAPMYLLATWFQKYLFHHIGNGPVWDYGTNNMTVRSICRKESWLWPLTLTTNFHPLHEECIMPAWYVASDMQFYIVTVFILIGLHRWPIITCWTTLGAIVASMIGRAHFYFTSHKVKHIELLRPSFDLFMRTSWDTHEPYLFPQYRIGSHLIGLLAGFYAYKVLRGDWVSPLYSHPYKKSTPNNDNNIIDDDDDNRRRRKSGILGKLTWLIGFQMICTMAYATWILMDLFPRSLEYQAKYCVVVIYATCYSLAGLGMALMLLGLIFGHFAPIRRFFTLPIWTLLSRVGYLVFLIQVEVLYWIYQSGERVQDFSGRQAFKYMLETMFLCYSISAILTLWIELPLAHLEREYLGNYLTALLKAKPASASHQKESQTKTVGQQQQQQFELMTRSESSKLMSGESGHQSFTPPKTLR